MSSKKPDKKTRFNEHVSYGVRDEDPGPWAPPSSSSMNLRQPAPVSPPSLAPISTRFVPPGTPLMSPIDLPAVPEQYPPAGEHSPRAGRLMQPPVVRQPDSPGSSVATFSPPGSAMPRIAGHSQGSTPPWQSSNLPRGSSTSPTSRRDHAMPSPAGYHVRHGSNEQLPMTPQQRSPTDSRSRRRASVVGRGTPDNSASSASDSSSPRSTASLEFSAEHSSPRTVITTPSHSPVSSRPSRSSPLSHKTSGSGDSHTSSRRSTDSQPTSRSPPVASPLTHRSMGSTDSEASRKSTESQARLPIVPSPLTHRSTGSGGSHASSSSGSRRSLESQTESVSAPVVLRNSDGTPLQVHPKLLWPVGGDVKLDLRPLASQLSDEWLSHFEWAELQEPVFDKNTKDIYIDCRPWNLPIPAANGNYVVVKDIVEGLRKALAEAATQPEKNAEESKGRLGEIVEASKRRVHNTRLVQSPEILRVDFFRGKYLFDGLKVNGRQADGTLLLVLKVKAP